MSEIPLWYKINFGTPSNNFQVEIQPAEQLMLLISCCYDVTPQKCEMTPIVCYIRQLVAFNLFPSLSACVTTQDLILRIAENAIKSQIYLWRCLTCSNNDIPNLMPDHQRTKRQRTTTGDSSTGQLTNETSHQRKTGQTGQIVNLPHNERLYQLPKNKYYRIKRC